MATINFNSINVRQKIFSWHGFKVLREGGAETQFGLNENTRYKANAGPQK